MSADESQSLVSLRDRREQVIEWLSDRFADDTLDEEEFERRLDLAYQATSVAAIEELVTDLDVSEAEWARPPSEEPAGADTALVLSRPERKTVVAVMGGAECKGRWTVPRRVRVTSIMGGVTLDFREAILPPGVTEVRLMVIMGGVEIIVPPDVAVQTEGVALMGGFEDVHRAPAVQDESVPQLVIRGFALMGGVEIKTRLPGESGWQAWRRQRRERRQLAGSGSRALGDGS